MWLRMSEFMQNNNKEHQQQTQNAINQTEPSEQTNVQSANENFKAQANGVDNGQEQFVQQENAQYAQQQQVYQELNQYGKNQQNSVGYPPYQQNQFHNGQYPLNGYYPNMVTKPLKIKQVFGRFEFIMWAVALVLGVLLDRTVFAHSNNFLAFYSAFFWLGYLIAFTTLYWRKVKKKKLYWLSSFFVVVLCSMSFIYDGNGPYTKLASTVVIPGTLLLTFLYGAFSISCFRPLQMFLAWLEGLIILGFRNLPSFSSVIGIFFKKNKESKVKNRTFKVLIGCLIALPIIFFLGVLLASSDAVFSYFLSDILEKMSLGKIIWHTILIFAFSSIIFSFLLNMQKPFNTSIEKAKINFQMDSTITYVVLTLVLVVYGMFCWVQFAYLFAGQGLPKGITYSEYAVKGFSEMIFVCSINLVAFGVVLLYTKEHIIKKILLIFLLVFTGVMLCSAGLRLYLYIDSYDLTWLRLLSGWFIVFMAMVLVICLVRLFTKKLPAVTVCFFVLLAWFSMLGISNPQKTIIEYNITNAKNPARWLKDNKYYMLDTATSETMIYLLENGYGKKILRWKYSDDYTDFMIEPYESPSFNGNKLRENFPRDDYFPKTKQQVASQTIE